MDRAKNITDLISRKLSVKRNYPESIISKIINFQFKEGRNALHLYKTIEFSNLFTLKVRPKKVEDKMKMYQYLIDEKTLELLTTEDDVKIIRLNRILKILKDNLEFLKSKYNVN